MTAEAAPAPQEPDIKPVPKKFESIDINDVDTDAEKKLTFEKAFQFEYKNPEDGKLLSGRFVARRLSIGALGQLGVLKARLNGGERVEGMIDFLHEQLAYLQLVLIEVPTWWSPADFYDLDIIRSIYDHVRHWEDNFRKRRVG